MPNEYMIPSFTDQIEVSKLFFVPCAYCTVLHADRRIDSVPRAYKILGKAYGIAKQQDHSRVLCDNGHIYAVPDKQLVVQR